jgi:hypothetical protein
VHISVLPKTSLGRWSVGLAIAFILFFVLAEVLTGFEVLGPGFNLVLALALTIVLAGISGVASATGLISMIKNREPIYSYLREYGNRLVGSYRGGWFTDYLTWPNLKKRLIVGS